MQKEIKPVLSENKSKLLLNKGRRLFKNTSEYFPEEEEKLKLANKETADDIARKIQNLLEKWRSLVQLFKDLPLFDYKNVIDYVKQHQDCIDMLCENVALFFSFLLQIISQEMIAYSNKVIQYSKFSIQVLDIKFFKEDDFMKIFAIHLSYLTKLLSLQVHFLKKQLNEKDIKELLIRRQTLNQILLYMLCNLKVSCFLAPYDRAFLQILHQSIDEMHESLSINNDSFDSTSFATAFYYNLETLAMIASCSKSMKFGNSKGNISGIYEAFKRIII